jgi:prevent-host-death family protein
MIKAVTSVGLFDAKTHLSELIERVERGESITITRRGLPVARLVPAAAAKESPAAAVERIRKLRVGNKLGKVTLRELIDEGRA